MQTSLLDSAIIPAAIAVIISITTGLIVYRDNRKARIGTVISHNRIEWIQLLKTHIATFLNEVNNFDLMLEKDNRKSIENDNYKKNYDLYHDSLGNIYHIFCNIKLHLNYKGKPDKEIIQLCRYIYNIVYSFIYNQKDTIGDEDVDVIEALQKYGEDCLNELIQLIEPSIIKANIEDMSYGTKLKLSSYLLTQLSQIYLKTEWERVKHEVKTGNVNDFNFDKEYNKKKKEASSVINSIVFILNLPSIINIE